MWGECERYTESTARTDKLWCSDCRRHIRKGEKVVFKLDTGRPRPRMKEVYGSCCSKNYEHEVVMDTQHPHDLDG